MPRKQSASAAAADKPPMSDLTQVTSTGTDSSTASTGSVNINDFEFCAAHGREVCGDCSLDLVADNDFCAGIDHVEGREPIEVAYTTNKNGEIVCKKHNQSKCACFAFKKQIVKLSKDAAKNSKKSKQPTSNLYG